MSQAASLGKDIAGTDGKTMIGEACADTAQPCSQGLKLREYTATNQPIHTGEMLKRPLKHGL